MNQDQLLEILCACYRQDISAVDAFDAIWGESFEGQTQKIRIKDLLASTKPQTKENL